MNRFLKVLNLVLIFIMGYNLNVYAGCGAPSCGGGMPEHSMPSPNIPIPDAVTPFPLPEFPIGNNAGEISNRSGVKVVTDMGEIKGNAFEGTKSKPGQ